MIEQKKAELETVKREWKEKITDIYRSVLTKEQSANWQQMESNEKHEKKKEYNEKKRKD